MKGNFSANPSLRPSIFKEFIIFNTLIVLVILLSMGAYLFHNISILEQEEELKFLNHLAETKASAINQHIDNYLSHVTMLSAMPSINVATNDFTKVFYQYGITSTEYQQLNSQYKPIFKGYLENLKYSDIFLMDDQGTIIYSLKHDSAFATNLQTGPYKETGLAQVFEQAKTLLQTNNSTLEYYAPSEEAAGFVATPIIESGHLIGVLALKFDKQALYTVINQFIGLGETGEVVVGKRTNESVLITAPLRHDPHAAFHRSIALNAMHARPLRESVLGHTGSGIIIDWRDEEVLAAWRYIPSLQWGMVVKTDTKEAFKFWQQSQNEMFIFIILVLLLSYLLIYWFTKRLTLPLRKLTKTAAILSSGNNHISFDEYKGAQQEVVTLGNTLNLMARNVRKSKRELERMVTQLVEHNDELDHRVAEQTARIRAIIASVTDAIITVDEHGSIQTINPAACEMLAASQAELVYTPITNFLSPSYIKQLETLFQHNSNKHEEHATTPTGSSDGFGIRHSGEEFSLELSANPMHVPNQNLFLIMMRDITEKKHEQEQLEHTQRLESLGIMAGGIAHDFNNLLTAILGNAALAKRRIEKESTVRPLIKNIEKASERAASLCKQMLAYSGKGQFVLEEINITNMVNEMVNLLDVSLQKNVVMRLELSEQLLPIKADASQIQQIIMNLVINASEAIGDKNGVITIHSNMVNIDQEYINTIYLNDDISPGCFIMLEVSDTGCGMDKETQSHVFDPFFTTKFTGRGLGMSAILGIIRGHHGAIKIYSELGEGTTFKVLFPCVFPTLKPANTSSLTTPLTKHIQQTVLIIDDEKPILAVGTMMLEDIGYHVLIANDGEEGLEVFKQHQHSIDIVIMDMTMPRLNGDETFRGLKVIRPDIKVILSSGYNEQEATSRFVGKGLAGFLQKPYTADVLYKKLSEALSKSG